MRRVRLDNIAKVTAGNVAPKSEDFSDFGLPFVRAGSLARLLDGMDIEELEKIDSATAKRLCMKVFPAGTVVFAKSGMSCLKGYVYILPTACYVVSHLACVTPKGDYSDYLQHYFRYQKPSRLIENPSFPSIKLSKISQMEIDLPDGHRIAEIVGALEQVASQIANARLMLKTFDELVKYRFVEMFGDPIENPCGWEASLLGKLGDLKNGVNFKSADSGKEIHCLGVGDFKTRYQISDMSMIPLISLSGEPKESQLLQDSDIVFVRSNGNKQLVGRCLAVFPGGEKLTFSGFCIRFRNESERLNLDYLLCCLKSDSMRNAMTGRGANIQNLTQKILSNISIPLPPLGLQQEFAAFVEQVDKLRSDTQQAIDKLHTLYDSLAQEYFGS